MLEVYGDLLKLVVQKVTGPYNCYEDTSVTAIVTIKCMVYVCSLNSSLSIYSGEGK